MSVERQSKSFLTRFPLIISDIGNGLCLTLENESVRSQGAVAVILQGVREEGCVALHRDPGRGFQRVVVGPESNVQIVSLAPTWCRRWTRIFWNFP